MKTTVELPDDLLVSAKKHAAETRRPLRAVIEQALREHLGRRGAGDRRKKRAIRWVTVRGELPPDLDLSNREQMHEWLRRNR